MHVHKVAVYQSPVLQLQSTTGKLTVGIGVQTVLPRQVVTYAFTSEQWTFLESRCHGSQGSFQLKKPLAERVRVTFLTGRALECVAAVLN